METEKTRRKRRRKPGDLAALRRVMWEAILAAERIMDEGASPDTRLRAAHALSALAGQYLKAVETTDLEQRIEALERALAERNGIRRVA